jgi:hypothetical protein
MLMETNESYCEQHLKQMSCKSVLNWMEWLIREQCYHLAILVGESVRLTYTYDRHLCRVLAQLYIQVGQPTLAVPLYSKLLLDPSMSEFELEQLWMEARLAYANPLICPYPEKRVDPLTHPESSPRSLLYPIITCTITTCKRLDLFERTMNSFLSMCLDLHLIAQWICIDDTSSQSDREQMQRLYPFLTFIWKSENEKGHAQSMNQLLDRIRTPYVFHLEDDW